MSRKIVIVIVEGKTDEDTLYVLNKMMNKYFYFHVVRGDVITDNKAREEDVERLISSMVLKTKKNLKNIEKVKDKDFLGVIQVTDLDAVYIPEKNIIYDNEIQHIHYEPPFIKTPNPENIVERNNRKKMVLKRLYKTQKIGGLPYAIFYCSCNLEHLFHKKLNCNSKEKVRLSEKISDDFEDDIELFNKIINEENVPIGENYIESWEYFEENGKESINRHTNLHILKNIVENMEN